VRIGCAFRPTHAASVRDVEDRVRVLATRAEPGKLRPAHRDFYDKQVLVEGDRVTFLDLDTACLAEPELDAGNFLAHLRLRSLQRSDEKIRELAGPFLEAYARRRGRLDPRRLHWYEAGSLLRLSCVYSFRPRCRSLSVLLLKEARILTRGSGKELKERP
jgi:aminoglycoside phosphotransferase (APT) family kinase protein